MSKLKNSTNHRYSGMSDADNSGKLGILLRTPVCPDPCVQICTVPDVLMYCTHPPPVATLRLLGTQNETIL